MFNVNGKVIIPIDWSVLRSDRQASYYDWENFNVIAQSLLNL